MGSGQSQFAPLKLRSLALVPSSGALTRPYELHSWQLHCKILPVAPRRSGQKLAAVPRRGFAGPGARGRGKKEQTTCDSIWKAVKPSVIILLRTSRLRAVPDKPALAFP